MDVRIFFKNDERVPLFLLILEVWPEPSKPSVFFYVEARDSKQNKKMTILNKIFFCTKSDVS